MQLHRCTQWMTLKHYANHTAHKEMLSQQLICEGFITWIRTQSKISRSNHVKSYLSSQSRMLQTPRTILSKRLKTASQIKCDLPSKIVVLLWVNPHICTTLAQNRWKYLKWRWWSFMTRFMLHCSQEKVCIKRAWWAQINRNKSLILCL